MNKELFLEELKKLGILLTPKQEQDLDTYYKLLISYNNNVNLTAITKEEDVYLKHFYDSLTLFKGIDLKENLKICDLGTGAGFPGLVLKIVFPNLSITLVDSLEKRIKFLDLVIKELELKNIKKSYKTGEFVQHALKGVSLTFDRNEFVCILGASGSGMTSLLNLIGGLD